MSSDEAASLETAAGGTTENLAQGTTENLAQGTTENLAQGTTGKLTQEEKRSQVCLYLRTRIVKRTRYSGVKEEEDFCLEKGAYDDAAKKFGFITRSGVRKLWAKHKNAICHPDKYELNVARKTGTGKKRKHDLEAVHALVKKVPCRYRHSLRTLSERVGVPKSTLHSLLKEVGLTGSTPSKQEATVSDEKETSEHQTISQKTQHEIKQIKLEQDKVWEEAKRNTRKEDNKRWEKMRIELQQEFQSEKDKVLYQLRAEMERHSSELARLKSVLDKLGSGSSSGGGSVRAEEKNEGEL